MRPGVHPGLWPSPERREQHGTRRHYKGCALFRNHSPGRGKGKEGRKEERKKEPMFTTKEKKICSIVIQTTQLSCLPGITIPAVLYCSISALLKQSEDWLSMEGKCVVIATADKYGCYTKNSQVYIVDGKLSFFFNLQATAVKCTCCFTDACVGGSENEGPERLCVWVSVVCGGQKKKYQEKKGMGVTNHGSTRQGDKQLLTPGTGIGGN